MLVIGELAAFGSGKGFAEGLPGPVEKYFCELAKKYKVWLIPGSLYEKREGEIFNTTSVINPDGKVVSRYSKMFPWTPYESGVEAGNKFVVFDVPDVGRLGISICYDMWFPETTRTLACMGAEVIIHLTMTNTIDRDAELAIVRASAVTNQCYVVDVNVAGQIGNGHSIVAGPGGEVIYQAGAGREIFPLVLDLSAVRTARERGWNGLGQPLKSFRDSKLTFPPYQDTEAKHRYLDTLGSLKIPE
jgi:predicted amidohydrolase